MLGYFKCQQRRITGIEKGETHVAVALDLIWTHLVVAALSLFADDPTTLVTTAPPPKMFEKTLPNRGSAGCNGFFFFACAKPGDVIHHLSA